MSKLRFAARRVIDPGCRFCRDLLAYTVVDESGKALGEVRMVRHVADHPDDWHYGVDWQAVALDGMLMTGAYSRDGFANNAGADRFITRSRAADQLRRAVVKDDSR